MRGQGLTIDVQVGTLINTLEVNRDKHLKAYERAKKGWEKLLQRELETKLKVLTRRPGAAVVRAIKTNGQSEGDLSRIINQKPTNYLGEYDEAIEMLKFADNATIELDQEQYRAYVKDEWSWKTHWEASNTAYAAAVR